MLVVGSKKAGAVMVAAMLLSVHCGGGGARPDAGVGGTGGGVDATTDA
jgi:hypothetical protein